MCWHAVRWVEGQQQVPTAATAAGEQQWQADQAGSEATLLAAVSMPRDRLHMVISQQSSSINHGKTSASIPGGVHTFGTHTRMLSHSMPH